MSQRENPAFFEISAPGIRCRLSALGASIVSVEVPDRRGTFTNIALSPRNFQSGDADPSLAGRTVGPCCGRVRDGLITIDGQQYQLEKNEGTNHIHGGTSGCPHQVWRGEQLSPAHVRFRLDLPDGLAGYPGNRALCADYTATDNALHVVYSATTDRPTWLCMTNHAYWDLSGRFDGSAMGQSLELAADRVIYNDAQQLPGEIVPTAGGAFDFSAPAAFESKLEQFPQDEQLLAGRGFNNIFPLNPDMQSARGFCARLASPLTGIRMTLQSDQPAIVLYSGGFLDARTQLDGSPAGPGCAIAIEAEEVPDPFHLPGVEPAILRPADQWQRSICWSFDIIEQ